MRMSLIFYAVDAAVPWMQFNPINLQIFQKRLSAERKLRYPNGPFIDQTIFLLYRTISISCTSAPVDMVAH